MMDLEKDIGFDTTSGNWEGRAKKESISRRITGIKVKKSNTTLFLAAAFHGQESLYRR